VVAFLSDAWLDELDAAARAATVPDDLELVVQQVVLGERGLEVSYALRISGGAASVSAGRADDADVTFTQDRATAEAIAKGELSAQMAFLAGQLRIGGDLRSALERSRAVLDLDDLFAQVRAATTW
jgi:putative sterol carrier protein